MQVDSCDGSFHLDHVNVYQHVEDMPKCDVVIVGLKTTNNHLLSSSCHLCSMSIPLWY